MSDIKGKCPHCGKSFKAPAEYEGREVKCSGCKQSFNLSNQTEPINVSLPFSKHKSTRRLYWEMVICIFVVLFYPVLFYLVGYTLDALIFSANYKSMVFAIIFTLVFCASIPLLIGELIARIIKYATAIKDTHDY